MTRNQDFFTNMDNPYLGVSTRELGIQTIVLADTLVMVTYASEEWFSLRLYTTLKIQDEAHD